MTFLEIALIGSAIVIIAILMTIGSVKLDFFLHRDLMNYLGRKVFDSNVKPSRKLKYTNRFWMYLSSAFVIGLMGFVAYAYYSTGRIVSAGCAIILAILMGIVIFGANSMMRRLDL